MHHHHPSNGPIENFRIASNLAMLIARIGAVSVEVFLHNRFGARYIGGQAAAVVLFIPVFSTLFPGQDARPLLWLLGGYLCMCAWARLGIVWRQRRGDTEHSRYNGWPRILRWDSRGERLTKQFVEPVLVFAGGIYALAYCEALGAYLMFAALCLVGTNAEFEHWEQQRRMELQDALFEQETNGRILRDLQRR